jgi:GNAT superfamily N-acetyltransferase
VRSREYTVRPATAADADAILRVHHDSVRILCSADYAPEQIAAWIGQEDDPDWLAKRIAMPGSQIVVAELYGSVAGFAERWEDQVGAVYVHPFQTRRGVGSMMLTELERSALSEGFVMLYVDASVTAEPFYLAEGFDIVSRGTHRFRDGTTIASVQMCKRLKSSAGDRECPDVDE